MTIPNKLYIIGIGPGHTDLITKKATDIIESCDLLIGGSRNLDSFKHLNKETFVIKNNLSDVAAIILENIKYKRIGVLATGDPFLFGIGEYLQKNLSVEMEIIPGISAIQYFTSKIKMKRDDLITISVHGRNVSVSACLAAHKKIGVFTGGSATPDDICKELIKDGFDDTLAYVGENLSYDNEKITVKHISEIAKMKFSDLSVMILVDRSKNDFQIKSGIPDSMFERTDVPMTKEEIRAVSISKLKLRPDSILYDIGAGTGSISIGSAIHSPLGRVYSIEKNIDAVQLILKNVKNFGLHNITVVNGYAPKVFDEIKAIPDRAFIGGSGGSMKDILKELAPFENIRIVGNAISIQSACELIEYMQEYNFSGIECVHISFARSERVKGRDLMKGFNPVYIVSGEKGLMI